MKLLGLIHNCLTSDWTYPPLLDEASRRRAAGVRVSGQPPKASDVQAEIAAHPDTKFVLQHLGLRADLLRP
jgi:hypothetical protein